MLKNIREQSEERAAAMLVVRKLKRNEKYKETNTQIFIGCRNHSQGDCRDRNPQRYRHVICFILPVIEIAVMIPRMVLKVTNFPTLFYGFLVLGFYGLQ